MKILGKEARSDTSTVIFYIKKLFSNILITEIYY